MNKDLYNRLQELNKEFQSIVKDLSGTEINIKTLVNDDHLNKALFNELADYGYYKIPRDFDDFEPKKINQLLINDTDGYSDEDLVKEVFNLYKINEISKVSNHYWGNYVEIEVTPKHSYNGYRYGIIVYKDHVNLYVDGTDGDDVMSYIKFNEVILLNPDHVIKDLARIIRSKSYEIVLPYYEFYV